MNKDNIKKMSSLLQNNAVSSDKYQLIKLEDIILDENQPRKYFDDESINELSDSIKQYGVLTPVSVSKLDNNKFILRHGERRYRATKLAGIDEIPVIIDNEYKEHTLIKQLIENLQRESLSNDEIAEAIKFLHYKEKMPLTDIAKALGKSNAYISNFHSYATMSIPIREKITKKTSDMIVISELNRIYKKISKDNSVLSKMLSDNFMKFLDTNKTLNRDSVDNLKNTLNYIETQYKDRQEKKEFININDEINESENSNNIEENYEIEKYLDDEEDTELNQAGIVDTVSTSINKDEFKKQNINTPIKNDEIKEFSEKEIPSIDEKINNNYIAVENNIVYLISNNEKIDLLTINNIKEDKINELILFIKKLYNI